MSSYLPPPQSQGTVQTHQQVATWHSPQEQPQQPQQPQQTQQPHMMSMQGGHMRPGMGRRVMPGQQGGQQMPGGQVGQPGQQGGQGGPAGTQGNQVPERRTMQSLQQLIQV